jgi:hypothetical protein
MTDTIELLEAIGSDASLRYASADELKSVLEQAQASVDLTMAVAAGDGARLREELGLQQMPQTHSAPLHEDDEEEEADIPQPDPRSPEQPSPAPTKETQ